MQWFRFQAAMWIDAIHVFATFTSLAILSAACWKATFIASQHFPIFVTLVMPNVVRKTSPIISEAD